jgi:flagellar hook-basal body complex protein FliE
MAIEAIKPLADISFEQIREKYQSSSDKKMFTDLLNNAIKSIDSGVELTDQGVEKILSGSSTDLNEIIIDMQKTEMTLDLTLQIREKVVDAYKEIMRMQI